MTVDRMAQSTDREHEDDSSTTNGHEEEELVIYSLSSPFVPLLLLDSLFVPSVHADTKGSIPFLARLMLSTIVSTRDTPDDDPDDDHHHALCSVPHSLIPTTYLPAAVQTPTTCLHAAYPIHQTAPTAFNFILLTLKQPAVGNILLPQRRLLGPSCTCTCTCASLHTTSIPHLSPLHSLRPEQLPTNVSLYIATTSPRSRPSRHLTSKNRRLPAAKDITIAVYNPPPSLQTYAHLCSLLQGPPSVALLSAWETSIITPRQSTPRHLYHLCIRHSYYSSSPESDHVSTTAPH